MAPGTKIGRYQIERELGHGGMGTVFLAEDPVIGRRVALKVIRLDDSGSAEQQHLLAQSFLKETRLAGVLRDPGVVGVFDAGKVDNLAYIVMEFIDGPTLEAMMRSEPRPEVAKMLGVCRQAAAVLDYAHAHGVIHRDIKPTNILVQQDGAVKICDFGIAKVMQSTEFTLTQTGMAVGTPEFMSPEQVLGQALDGRSDQWSLAVVAYEVATGVKPFHADSYTQVMARIMTLDPEPPSKQVPDLPTEVDSVFARALSKKAPDRFPTCGEFMAALEKAFAPAPVPARAPAVVPAAPVPAVPVPAAVESEPSTVRTMRKARPRWLIAAAAIVLAIGGGAAALRLFRRPTPVPVESVPPPVSEKAPQPHLHVPGRAPKPAAQQAKAATDQAAARETPAPKSYPVQLVTVPDGAEVTIYNTDMPDSVCLSPCRVELTAGLHKIQATKEGYYPLPKSFEVDGQQLEFHFPLIQITGSVVIESEPAGASISMNCSPHTETTPATVDLPVGPCKVKWTKDGFEPVERDVTVSSGAITSVRANLVKSSH